MTTETVSIVADALYIAREAFARLDNGESLRPWEVLEAWRAVERAGEDFDTEDTDIASDDYTPAELLAQIARLEESVERLTKENQALKNAAYLASKAKRTK